MSLFGIPYLPESITPDVYAHPQIETRRYAIIGAGSAGLCAMKYLKQAGAEKIVCYETGTKIAGLWCYENDNNASSAYRTLHINTARTLTRFSHMDLPADAPPFPHHTDMYNYFIAYAENFDLVRHIRFNAHVTSVRHAPGYTAEAPKWEVETASGVEVYDCVIVASGHLSNPAHVPMFQKQFEGEYMHSHHYRDFEGFAGKRVCIVGAANSAFDMASDICPIAKRCVMVARSGVVVSPKTVFGVPFRDITLHLDRPWVPDKVRRKITALLIKMMHGDMTKLGFKKQSRRQHATSNGALVNHIVYRRIAVKHGIDEIEGKRIFFVDGTSEEFDVLIAATGYRIELPFLSEEIVPTDGINLNLYKRMVPPGEHGLYLLGFVNTTIALVLMFEHQMKWILAFDSGEAELPPMEEMFSDIAAKKAWIEKEYGSSERYSLEEPHLFYFPQLERSVEEGIRRRQHHAQRPGRLRPQGSTARAEAR